VKGCLSWSRSTPLEPLTIEGLFGQGQGQAQVCVYTWLCTKIITESKRELLFIDGSIQNILHIILAGLLARWGH